MLAWLGLERSFVVARHAFVLVHGMGTEGEAAYAALTANLEAAFNEQTGSVGQFKTHFDVRCVQYYEATSGAEERLYALAFPGLPLKDLSPGAILGDVKSIGSGWLNDRGLPGGEDRLPGVRSFMTFFLGDVVAYASENDNAIRSTYLQSLRKELIPFLKADPGNTYSLVAHSLGSVVSHDFLFHLLHNNVLFDLKEPPTNDDKLFLSRFRDYYSFGSPIGLFFLRNAKNVATAPGKLKSLAGGENRRLWVNLWDRQDVFAHPLNGFFGGQTDETMVHDVEVNVAEDPVRAHMNYWHTKQLADKVVMYHLGHRRPPFVEARLDRSAAAAPANPA